MTSSFGVSTATAAWLSKKFVEHRLKKDVESYKRDLKIDLEEHKDGLNRQRDELQALLRRKIESALGDEAADRQYALEARKRLYVAIGPLRFQLLLACRQACYRIQGHSLHPYATRMDQYYGRNTLYRILRPMAISDLIERQIAYADFAVDPTAIKILCFRRATSAAWSGEAIVLNHPEVNWETQEQHVVSDRLVSAAETLIDDSKPGAERVLRYKEFESRCGEDEFLEKLQPFPALLGSNFSATDKPLLWLRFISYGYICNELICTEGAGLGFEKRNFPIQDMLAVSGDPHIATFMETYIEAIRNLSDIKL